MTPLTRAQIATIFAPLAQAGQSSKFFDHVADDVHWTITGHSPMAGVYTTKADFLAATLDVLGSDVLTEPLRIEVQNVVAGGMDDGDEQQAAVELKAKEGTVCRNGLKYDMTYAWFLTFGRNQKITKVRAYLDSDLLTRAITQNKKSS